MLKSKKKSAPSRKRSKLTILSTRPERVLVCPGCGNTSPWEADVCHVCGTIFIFLDETNRFCC
jgi:ribosomal protein L40E